MRTGFHPGKSLIVTTPHIKESPHCPFEKEDPLLAQKNDPAPHLHEVRGYHASADMQTSYQLELHSTFSEKRFLTQIFLF